MNVNSFKPKGFLSSRILITVTLSLLFSLTIWFNPCYASDFRSFDLMSSSENLGLSNGTVFGTVSLNYNGTNSVGFVADLDETLFGGSVKISQFYLNSNLVLNSTDFSLPSNWSANFDNYQVGPYGTFDIKLSNNSGANGSIEPLSFTVTNLNITGINDFLVLSGDDAPSGYQFFAVKGVSFGTDINGIDSSYFSVPDADIMFLLGPALIFLALFERRRAKA